MCLFEFNTTTTSQRFIQDKQKWKSRQTFKHSFWVYNHIPRHKGKIILNCLIFILYKCGSFTSKCCHFWLWRWCGADTDETFGQWQLQPTRDRPRWKLYEYNYDFWQKGDNLVDNLNLNKHMQFQYSDLQCELLSTRTSLNKLRR